MILYFCYAESVESVKIYWECWGLLRVLRFVESDIVWKFDESDEGNLVQNISIWLVMLKKIEGLKI